MSPRKWLMVVSFLGLAPLALVQGNASKSPDVPKTDAPVKSDAPAKPADAAKAEGPSKTSDAAKAADAPSVDNLIAKNIDARGGKQKIQAVKTMHMTMKVTGSPMEIKITQDAKRPNSFRQDVSVQDQMMSTAYDGKQGWKVNPFAGYGGKKDAQDMTPDELRMAEEEADMDGELVDYKAKGHQVESMGKEPVEGSDAYKLKVTLKNGDIKYVFLDTETFLEVKRTSKHKINDTEVEAFTFFGDYKEVGGLMIPYSIEAGAAGMPQRQKLAVEKIEFNVPVEDSRFVKPAAPPAPAAAPEAAPKPTGTEKPN